MECLCGIFLYRFAEISAFSTEISAMRDGKISYKHTSLFLKEFSIPAEGWLASYKQALRLCWQRVIATLSRTVETVGIM